MEGPVRRTVVVSGVNLNKGGTLAIMKECLSFLSEHYSDSCRIVALVMDRNLALYPGIEYIELTRPKKSWLNRLWCEYVTMRGISKRIAKEDGTPVYLWFSLHDTTPNVVAEHRAVYCHTSFPFFKWTMRDFRMDFKIPLFAMFTKFAYRINCHRNDWMIVQQSWFRDGLSALLGVPASKFIVAPPASAKALAAQKASAAAKPLAACPANLPLFFYASTPDCHKNFETLCEASRLLEEEIGKGRFRTLITISGKENRYSEWLHATWGSVESVEFAGFQTKESLRELYAEASCFVFPSRVETWGLPISEYMAAHPDGLMLLADLPYAHETSSGSAATGFFKADDAVELKKKMKEVISGNTGDFKKIPVNECAGPVADDWAGLFEILLPI